jgi:hypothetical protein
MKRKIHTDSQGAENERDETWLETHHDRIPRQQIDADQQVERPQRKFTMGSEGPMPRGLANGVGKGSPRNPETRWGMQLQRKAPAKKATI